MITLSTIYNLCPYIEFEASIRKWYQFSAKVITIRVWYTHSKLVDYLPKNTGISIPFDDMDNIESLIDWIRINGYTITKIRNKRGGS